MLNGGTMSWLDTLEDIRKKDFSKAPAKDRDRAARDVVNLCSYSCAAIAVSPIPFSDAVLSFPIQSAMVVTVGHIYGRKVTTADAKDLILELGASAGFSLLARQGIKALLPIIGPLLTIPAAFATNWAMGRVAIEYFRVPGTSSERLKQVYREAKKEASGLFTRDKLDIFRKGPKAAAPVAKKTPAPAKKKKATKKKPAAKKASPVAKVIEGDFADRVASHPGSGDGREWPDPPRGQRKRRRAVDGGSHQRSGFHRERAPWRAEDDGARDVERLHGAHRPREEPADGDSDR